MSDESGRRKSGSATIMPGLVIGSIQMSWFQERIDSCFVVTFTHPTELVTASSKACV